MRPWIGIIETAPLGMGAEVRAATANAGLSLGRRIVMTPAIEAVIADARLASDTLGISLNRQGSASVRPRAAAVLALEALIAQLHEARPNERAKGLGLGW